MRFPDLKIDLVRFSQVLKEVGATVYLYNAKTHQAPAITNCVTVLRYLLERSSLVSLPPTWLGDLPRMLAITYGCELRRVSVYEVQRGDLLFFREGVEDEVAAEVRWIPHVAIGLGHGEFLHSSWARKGVAIEHFCQPRDGYARRLVDRIIQSNRVFWYIDPRNEGLRKKYGTEMWVPLSRQLEEKNPAQGSRADHLPPRTGDIGVSARIAGVVPRLISGVLRL